MKKTLAISLLVVVLMMICPMAASAASDPTKQVNRLRVVMTTSSDFSHLITPTGTSVVNSKIQLVSGSAQLYIQNNCICTAGNIIGHNVTSQFDVLLTTDGVSDGQWRVEKGWGNSSHVDIYNMNDNNNPRLISSQDISPTAQVKTFTISGADESRGGPLSSGDLGPKRVLGIYIPWWAERNHWLTDSQLTDLPTTLYGTAHSEDVVGEVDSAIASGLDGFLCSWQGKDHPSDLGFQALLQAAHSKPGFTAAAYVETRVANAAHRDDCLPSQQCQQDPTYIKNWITDIVQDYGSDPSYQKIEKKMADGQTKVVPVIYIYWAGYASMDRNQNGNLSLDQWNQIIADLHAQGVDAFYVAETVDVSYLSVFDGIHTYAAFDGSAVGAHSIQTKTYSMITDPNAERKLWMATVMPGYDYSSTPERYTDRAGGDFYSNSWDTALDSSPDWVMVSTWNQFRENTEVESSRTYGSFYAEMTRTYSDLYRAEDTGYPLTMSRIASTGFIPGGFMTSWQTNRTSSSTLEYGNSQGVYTSTIDDGDSGTDHKVVVTGLQPGTYYGRVHSIDSTGSQMTSPEFTVTVPSGQAPRVSITPDHGYWRNYPDYVSGKLTYDFRVANSGQGDVKGMSITQIFGTNGVKATGQLPVTVGDIHAGAQRIVTIEWQIPSGVSHFRADFWANATMTNGISVYYPSYSELVN